MEGMNILRGSTKRRRARKSLNMRKVVKRELSSELRREKRSVESSRMKTAATERAL